MQKKEDIVRFYEQQLKNLQQEKERAYIRRGSGTIISNDYLIVIDKRIQNTKEIIKTIKKGCFS